LDKILAPLDGSDEGARALQLAEVIALAQQAELLLVRVVEPLPTALTAAGGDISPETYESFRQTIQGEVEAAMARLAEDVAASGARVRTAILGGPVESTLLDLEATERPDLVVMATHGRTGLARFALGSVTDRLVREGTAPVLVVRRSSSATATLDRALVMLDGSGVAEQALGVVKTLAGRPLRTLMLYRVVADPDDREPAMTYLEGVKSRLATDDLEITCVVDVGEPTHDVERAAHDVDLVILCTHGRSGFDRLRHGSVAEHVVREVDKPVLLVRASA
jgi:nucleotide-binding universal stress UspA family protein